MSWQWTAGISVFSWVNASEIKKAYPRYDVLYGVFSKSGFTQRMLDVAKENSELFLINEDSLV